MTPYKRSKPAKVLTFLYSNWVTQKSLHLTCMDLLFLSIMPSCHLTSALLCFWMKAETSPPKLLFLRCNVPNSCSYFPVKASFIWCRNRALILTHLCLTFHYRNGSDVVVIYILLRKVIAESDFSPVSASRQGTC